MSTREEILAKISELQVCERCVRRTLSDLSEEYTNLLAEMKRQQARLLSYEKERLELEASLVAIKKCKPRESGHTKKKAQSANMLQALSSLSKEERQALIAALSAM